MLSENIKKFRKNKAMSQDELATELHVVRQTVSKWEHNLSVPDADVLIRMAQLFDISVGQLLGIEETNKSNRDLSEELAKLNGQITEMEQREESRRQANRKRSIILFLSFLTMLITLRVKNAIVSVILAMGCVLAVTIILYRNLALLTDITTDDKRMGTLRITTLFNIGLFVVGVISSILVALDVITFTENGEKMFAMLFVLCVMLFAGIVSPKLPYSKHTGLRLPWTVQDEDTWNVAHKIIGHISIPVAVLYLVCTLTISDFEMVTLGIILVWLGIPGGISCVFFHRKRKGMTKENSE